MGLPISALTPEEIAVSIEAEGADVDLVRAESVESVAPYDLVIVGGALYTGRWHTHAVALLQRHHEELSGIPLAVFAMGPRTLEDDDVATSRHQVEGALASLAVEPFSVTIFGGVIDPAKLRFPFSRMEAVDARDHTAIQGWARDVLHTALSTSSA